MRSAIAINPAASFGSRQHVGAQTIGHPAVRTRRVRMVKLSAPDVVA